MYLTQYLLNAFLLVGIMSTDSSCCEVGHCELISPNKTCWTKAMSSHAVKPYDRAVLGNCTGFQDSQIIILSFHKIMETEKSTNCKSWKSYWDCQIESGPDVRLVLEFSEDFPDWRKEYWMWRSKYISEFKLQMEFHTQTKVRLEMQKVSNNATGNDDLDKFKTMFLQDLNLRYCFDAFNAQGTSVRFPGTSNKTQTTSFSCSYLTTMKQRAIQDVYIVLLFIASIILLLTCLVYVLIWEDHNVHGWTIFSEVVSNFFMILTVGLAHYYVRDLFVGPASPACIALAMLSHFFFLSTFHWMTVINFSLWRTFRLLRNPAGRNQNKVLTYCSYAAFAVGVPLLIVVVGLLVDIWQSHLSDNEGGSRLFIRPHYGKKFCYISKEAQGHYIYYPIGTLIVTNVVLFGLTVRSLLQHRRETKVLEQSRRNSATTASRVKGRTGKPGESNNCNNSSSQGVRPTQSFFVFAKLFCVMGVSWVFEVFAWTFSKSGEDVPLYWIIFDVTNLLQAIAVFVIFVCKKRVLLQVKKKIVG